MQTNDTGDKPKSFLGDNILRGYTTQERPYAVTDYPYGFRLRTTINYWIESKAKVGDRFCSYTINPKTGRPNKPKCGTYSTFIYMYFDDKGHVTHGSIDSYDIKEFKMRFGFIIDKIGEQFITEVQKDNIRRNHLQHVYGTAPYQVVKYSADKQKEFKKWLGETLHYIQTCEFSKLVDYPERPEYDNPDGELKMTVIERPAPTEEKSPVDVDALVQEIKDLLKPILNEKFTVDVWKNASSLSGSYYLGISAAVSTIDINNVRNQKPQLVSLILHVDSWELKPQGFGGMGGQSIYRDIDKNNPNERFLAMKGERVPFRTPPANKEAVLKAIARFFENYIATLKAHRAVLKYQDIVNYDDILNMKPAQV